MHKINTVLALLICLSVSFSVSRAAKAVNSVEKVRVITKYGPSDEYTFNHPAQISYQVGSNRVFVLDAGEPVAITLDTTGRFVRRFPTLKHSPDSLIEPGDIMQYKGFVWILDREGAVIHQFTKEGRHISQFETGIMPFSFTGTNNNLVCVHLLGKEMVPYNIFTGEGPRGYSKEPSKFAMVIGMFRLFGKMSYLDNGPSGHIFAAYQYKNRIEKYDESLDRMERVKLTENTDVTPAAKEESDDGKIVISGGTMFSRDICVDENRVFVLWRVEDSGQQCQGQTHLSIFDSELQKRKEINIKECLESISVRGNFMIATSLHPRPSVIFYRIKGNR